MARANDNKDKGILIKCMNDSYQPLSAVKSDSFHNMVNCQLLCLIKLGSWCPTITLNY